MNNVEGIYIDFEIQEDIYINNMYVCKQSELFGICVQENKITFTTEFGNISYDFKKGGTTDGKTTI